MIDGAVFFKKTDSWIKSHVKKDGLLWMVLRQCKRILCQLVNPLINHCTQIFLHPPHFFISRYIHKNSIFLYEDEIEGASLFPQKIMDETIDLYKPRTILDLGCGVGKALDYFLLKKIDTLGVEGSQIAVSKANNPQQIMQYNLEKELNINKKFDLIWSFEFVEHIHPKYVDNLMKTFSNHSDNVVLSAAQPGQGGDGHFNEQPEGYWINQFARFRYRLNREKTEMLRAIDEPYAKNMLIFERTRQDE